MTLVKTPQAYMSYEAQAKAEFKKEKVNVRDVKKILAKNEQFISELRKHDIGQKAFTKYLQTVARFRDPELRQRSLAVRQGMVQPRRRYQGCLATKIQPEDYRSCLDEYNDPKFDNIQLVPNALKKHVYETTQDGKLREALAPTIQNPKNSFADLPSGLKSYIKHNPSEFASYVNERKDELY